MKSWSKDPYCHSIGPWVRRFTEQRAGRSVAFGFPPCSEGRTREEVTHLTITESVGSVAAPQAAPSAVSFASAHDAATVAKAVFESLDDSKAEDIVTLDIADKSSLADLMIVASGRSHRHVGALADRLVDDLEKIGIRDVRIEGLPHCDWVLIDLGDVLVHLFRPEVRGFYNLEKMWSAEPTAAKPTAKA